MNQTQQTKICSKCGENKHIERFSLARGKHSADRKTYCVDCETLARKARKKYDMEPERLKALLAMPCSVCGDESKHVDKTDQVNGVLCKRCFSFLKSVEFTDDQEVIQKCYNYLTFRERFPFWLKMELEAFDVKPETPLLDYIDERMAP